MNLESLVSALANPDISRQRKYQITKILAGGCEACGKPRGKDRKDKTRCKKCEKRRYRNKGKEAKK